MGVTLVIYCFSESGAYICSGTYLISACVSAGSGRSVSNTANIRAHLLLSREEFCQVHNFRLFLSFIERRWRVGNQAHYKIGQSRNCTFLALNISGFRHRTTYLKSIFFFTNRHKIVIIQDILDDILRVADGATDSFPNVMHDFLAIGNKWRGFQLEVPSQCLFAQPSNGLASFKLKNGFLLRLLSRFLLTTVKWKSGNQKSGGKLTIIGWHLKPISSYATTDFHFLSSFVIEQLSSCLVKVQVRTDDNR